MVVSESPNEYAVSTLSALLEELPTACLLLTDNGCVRQANRAARQLFDWPVADRDSAAQLPETSEPSEPPEPLVLSLQAGLAATAQQSCADFLQQCLSAQEGQDAVSCELPLRVHPHSADQAAPRWVRLSGRMCAQTGPAGAALIVVQAQEITAERNLLQQTRQQLDFHTHLCASIPGILFQYQLKPDGSTGFPYVNASILRMYGLTQDQVCADDSYLIGNVHPDDLAALHASMRASAASMQIWRQEYRMVLPEGKTVWRVLEASPEKLVDGSVLWHGYTIDASEYRHLLEAVQRSADHCKLVIEGVGDGVWDWDVSRNVIDYSTLWKNMFAFAEDEITNHPDEWRRRIHPDDLEIADRNGQNLLDGVTEQTSIEVRMRARDGRWLWILTRSAVVSRDSSGRPLRIVGTNVDITEHRVLEEQVRRNEQRWKQALDSLEHGFWEWELESNKCVYSSRWKAILGYADDEIKEDAKEWTSRLHPDDQSVVDESFRGVITREKPSDQIEFRMRCKDGSWKWVMGSGILVEEKGQPLRIIGGMSDITERKRVEHALRRSEERWKFALEGGGDGVWDWDAANNKIAFSLRSAQILGFTEEEMEWDYDEWCRRVHPDDFERGTRLRELQIRDGLDASAVELRIRHGEGHWIWVLSRGLVVQRDKQGIPIRLVGAISDITERKREEEQLQQLLQEIDARRYEAEQLTLAKSNFFSAASHDLRQPLYAAQLFVDALVQDTLNSSQREVVERLQHAIKSMSGQLETLLDITRFDMGKLEAQKMPVSIARIFQEIENTFEPIARDRGMELYLHPIHAHVHTDPILLNRLLGNLLDNALKFSTAGKVLICARRTQLASGDEAAGGGVQGIRIEIRDSGPGIAAEFKQKIFDEYFQIGNPERNSSAGLGLGLSIVQRIANLLDLQLGLRSESGRGTVFSVALPEIPPADAPVLDTNQAD